MEEKLRELEKALKGREEKLSKEEAMVKSRMDKIVKEHFIRFKKDLLAYYQLFNSFVKERKIIIFPYPSNEKPTVIRLTQTRRELERILVDCSNDDEALAYEILMIDAEDLTNPLNYSHCYDLYHMMMFYDDGAREKLFESFKQCLTQYCEDNFEEREKQVDDMKRAIGVEDKDQILAEFKALNGKYPERMDMTEEQERSYVEECFDLYEKTGFCETFHSRSIELAEMDGKRFKVIGRCTTEDFDQECLPAWKIQFSNGAAAFAFPEEICIADQD